MLTRDGMERIRPGVTVRVFQRVKEGDREKVSRFEGLVLARKHGREAGASFTVRATVAGVGMEKVFPLYLPSLEKVEVLSRSKRVRRAKLYFVRDLSKKGLRKKIGSVSGARATAETEAATSEVEAAAAVASEVTAGEVQTVAGEESSGEVFADVGERKEDQ